MLLKGCGIRSVIPCFTGHSCGIENSLAMKAWETINEQGALPPVFIGRSAIVVVRGCSFVESQSPTHPTDLYRVQRLEPRQARIHPGGEFWAHHWEFASANF